MRPCYKCIYFSYDTVLLGAGPETPNEKLDLKTLQKELTDVSRDSWIDVGLELGVPPCTLDNIKYNFHPCERQKLEMLKCWMKGTSTQVSWKKLAEALSKSKYEALSQSIERKYLHDHHDN